MFNVITQPFDLAFPFMAVQDHPALRAFQAGHAGSIPVGRSRRKSRAGHPRRLDCEEPKAPLGTKGSRYRPDLMALVSFDIDGTMEFGDPPGPVSLEMVRESKRRGHIVGSASDRTLLEQRRLWDKAGIEVDFVSHKHFLEETKASFPSDRLIHIGDTDVDEHYALLAGFEFFHVNSLPAPSSPNWVY